MRHGAFTAAALACGVAPSAAAWSPAGLDSLDVPSAPSSVSVVELDGRTRLLGVGEGGTWLVDPSDGRAIAVSDRGGGDAILADLDADGVSEVLVCADDGLWRLDADLAGDRRLTDEACEAVAVYTDDDGPGVVTASRVLALWKVRGGALTGPGRFGLALGGPPILASDGARFVAVGNGGDEIVQRSAFGRSSIAAGGPVAGLAGGDDGAWHWVTTDPPRLEDTARNGVDLAADPLGLIVSDLDGDGRSERVVWHPGRIGVVGPDGREALSSVPMVPSAVAAGDLDGDGCAELVLAQAGLPVVGVARGGCEAPVASDAVDPAADPSEPPDAVEEAGEPPSEAEAEAEVPGIVLTEAPATATARIGEPFVAQLVDPRGQPDSFAARGGPDGLVVDSDGRVTFTPSPAQEGSWRVTVRLWGGPGLVSTRAFWIDVLPADAPVAADEIAEADPDDADTSDAPADDAPSVLFERSAWSVRSCNASVGLAGSLSAAQRSWEFIGQGVVPRASPALAFTCEGGWERVRWFGGWDTAPLVEYVMDASTRGSHLLGLTGGVVFGDDALRFGPYGTVGANLMGIGGRAVWTPIAGGHGLELRATLFAPSGPAGELLLLYTWQLGAYE